MKRFHISRKTIHRLLAVPGEAIKSLRWSVHRLVFRSVESLNLWWKGRNTSLLLLGLPAIVVISTAVGFFLAARAASYDQSKLFAKYKLAADRAVKDQRFEEAKLYLERLIQFPTVGHEILFEYAKVAQKVEDYPKMAAALRALSPDDEAVYAPAHLWQAMQILSQSKYTAEELELAKAHLLHAVQLRPDDANANRLLGEIYFSNRDFSAALGHLQKILRVNPGHNLMAATACVEMGESTLAVKYVSDGLAYFSETCDKTPRDFNARLKAAECHLMLGQFKQATDILISGIQLEPVAELNRALAQTFALWSDSIGTSKVPDVALQFELLSSGVKAYPDEPLLFERILRILISGGTTAQSARDFLLENIATGRATGLSHLLLGAFAHAAGDLKEAEKHLQLAFDTMEQADIAANNLAWLLFQSSEQMNRERALALINPVVERNPAQVRYLDTRGHVLMSLGRHRDAILDLEKYIAAHPENSVTHESLARCYDEIGLKDVADAHRKQVQLILQNKFP